MPSPQYWGVTRPGRAADLGVPQRHWDDVYQRLTPEGVSWYDPHQSMSLELMGRLPLPAAARILDVGAGASTLVDRLVARGCDVTVLDVSETALRTAKERVGAGKATWIHADLLAWDPSTGYDLWHDRAVYHFLTEDADRRKYAALANRAVSERGYVILATFAPHGPERCSGLPVKRYGVGELAGSLGPDFELAGSAEEDHVTPKGIVQPFTWVVLRRRRSAG